MTSIDLIILCFIIGAAFTGYRRGFIREALVLAMWLPIYAVSAILIFTTYSPMATVEASQKMATNDVLWTLGAIFFIGNVMVYLINKTIVQPWLYNRRLHNTEFMLKLAGFGLGGMRFLAVGFATLLIYDIYVSPLAFTKLPNSEFVKEGYEYSKPVKRWLLEEGYIDGEIHIYEKSIDDNEERMRQLLKGAGLEGVVK